MSDLSFPCIICGKTLEPVGEAPHQPYDGVMCQTAGNYGSRVFDPFDGSMLAFNICDDCIVESGKKGRVFLTHTPHVKVKYAYRPWRKSDEVTVVE